MADGTITFSTALDNGQLEKDLKDAEKKVSELERKVERGESEKNAIADRMKEAQAEVDKTEQRIAALLQRLKELDAMAETDPVGASGRAEAVTEEFVEQAKTYDRQLASVDKLKGKWDEADAKVGRYGAELEAARRRQADLGAEYARSYSSGAAAFGTSMTAMNKRFDAFTAKITKRLKKLFVFSLIFKALGSLKSYIGDALAENERFSASFANLKATLSGFAQPVMGFLVPTITAAVNVFSAMLDALARLVDSVFGTAIQQSIAAARAAAQAAGAVDDQAKATRKLAKATKEASRQLMAFDEINMITAQDSGDVADDLGDLAGGDVAQPNWSAFDVGKIDAKLSEIMLILGAALLAVGAVLAFSGINIPLGLTLMAIGALMVYTAYQENWQQLPAELRRAITTALVFTGVALVVIGAVLAFSNPATAPIGIGLMAAGAVMLWTAVALNWEQMPAEMRMVVSVLMAILSAALLVIGAIIAFSNPAAAPLGIALMVLGAASLAAVAAINWNDLPAEVRKTVTELMVFLGGSMLVIGAILALGVPSAQALGVGLMIAGAVTLASAAALNWNQMPDRVRHSVSVIAAVLGAAFLVVGAVLAFSNPASAPLGIAIMAVGAVSMAAAVGLNWDWLQQNFNRILPALEAAVAVMFLALGAVLAFSNPASAPLGIALLAVGAAGLVAAAALNWDKLPKQVKDAIAVITIAVGAATLVLGAVLAFSGANIPLGIALLAAGAATLIASIALNWNYLPQQVRDTVSAILGIVGAALIVIGIILCVTGVGIPLGVALILAGAANLVTAVALNFDWIVDTIASVWSAVVSWWNANVAHIFTWSFWKGVFVSMVNGLIYCINSALNDFGWFLNNLTSGISWVLSCFGVNWYGRITMPQIPYLAQGAVIPPNRRFMAVLGDQTSGNNIEAPEGLIRQIVREESGAQLAETMQSAMVAALVQAAPMLSGGSAGQGGGDVTMVLQVGYEELARAVSRGNASLARRGELEPGLSFA